jgi:hypothetical protein
MLAIDSACTDAEASSCAAGAHMTSGIAEIAIANSWQGRMFGTQVGKCSGSQEREAKEQN